MKKVKVINTRTGTPVSVETEATTFGALKTQLLDMGEFESIDFAKSHCFVRDSSGRRTIGLPEEVLPTEDFTLFITVSQMKGGSTLSALKSTVAALYSKVEELKETAEEVADELIGVENDIQELITAQHDENNALNELESDDIAQINREFGV
jgi:hypothetical protein